MFVTILIVYYSSANLSTFLFRYLAIPIITWIFHHLANLNCYYSTSITSTCHCVNLFVRWFANAVSRNLRSHLDPVQWKVQILTHNKTTTTSSGAFVVYSILIEESTHTLVVLLTVYTILVVANLVYTLVVTHTFELTLVVVSCIVDSLLVVRQL